jgi:outer membrane lipoprotein-sorting protein
MMKMRSFTPAALLAPLLALLLALPAAAADKIPLAEISRYLNSLSTVEADFTQVNSDGSQVAGKLFIRRPGRMRFEYTGDKTLVLASGGQVAIFDAKSNQSPEQYPLSRTPLNLILAPKVDLARNKMVMAHVTDGTLTAVTAQDPDHPEVGTIQLIFSAAPTMLRQWVVTDDTGAQTRVSLSNMQTGATYPPSLFSITDEASKRGF